MSYDVSLMMNTGAGLKEIVDCGNYTYNVSPMFRDAFGEEDGINRLQGIMAEDAIYHLEKAIHLMQHNPDHYRTMNPKNGWGSYEGALGYLQDILKHCKEHPLTQIKIS